MLGPPEESHIFIVSCVFFLFQHFTFLILEEEYNCKINKGCCFFNTPKLAFKLEKPHIRSQGPLSDLKNLAEIFPSVLRTVETEGGLKGVSAYCEM